MNIFGRSIVFGVAAYFTQSGCDFLVRTMPDWSTSLALNHGPVLWLGGWTFGLFGLPAIASANRALVARGNIWVTGPGRWVIGRAAGTTAFAAQMLAFGAAMNALTGSERAAAILCALMTPVGLILLPKWKTFIGRSTRPFRRLISEWKSGMGGSAALAGILDEWAHPWRPGQILLGSSMFDRKWKIGIRDDRHFLTVATSRAGKGRDAIVSNLLTWPGSALVIDPKGQNAGITAGPRRRKGHTTLIVDPMGELAGRGDFTGARFNPLAALSPDMSDYHEKLSLIAEALILADSGTSKNGFFDGSGRVVASGLCDTVIRADIFPPHEKNLGTVRDLLTCPQGLPTKIMSDLGGKAGAAAALLKRASDKAGGDVFATVIEQTKWLDSPGIRNALSASDFDLLDLNNGHTTVYLVIAPQYLDVHARFLRLFVNLALAAAAEGRKGAFPTLFVFDEFYSLGRLEMLAKAAGNLAGYGVKLWPIVHNLGQLQELFPNNWENFLGNAGQWQIFAMNDRMTADYFSARLGKKIQWRKVVTPDGEEELQPGQPVSLRDVREITYATSRESRRQIVFTEGGDAFLLRRDRYDEMFNTDQYDPDPFEKTRPSKWAGLRKFCDLWASLLRNRLRKVERKAS